jgi:transcriptional antiterminator NusG
VNDEPDNSIDERRPGDVVVGPPAGVHADDQQSAARPSAAEDQPPLPGDELALPGDESALPSDELALPSDELALPMQDEADAEQKTDAEAPVAAVAHSDAEENADEEPAPGSASGSNGGGGSNGGMEREPRKLDWFILKVQSNREDSIREALLRRIAVAGLGESFDQIIVPIEKVSEFKNGKKRIVKRKLYPGYLVVHMEYNDDTWYLVRETPGIGDFTGSGGKPTPMAPHEVSKIISIIEPDKPDETPRINIPYKKGDRVKINEGTFENFEGDVDHIDEANGRVTVMINIFGRSTPVELEYWQIEKL